MTIHSLTRLGAAALLVVGLAACAEDPEQTALERYVSDAQDLSQDMTDAGGRFETLMNVQGDIATWTDAEKDEIAGIAATFDRLHREAERMAVPEALTDVHPLLVEAIAGMADAVRDVADLSHDSSRMTEENAASLQAKAETAQEKADAYAAALEKALDERYPDERE